jgi:hypothetical protein
MAGWVNGRAPSGCKLAEGSWWWGGSYYVCSQLGGVVLGHVLKDCTECAADAVMRKIWWQLVQRACLVMVVMMCHIARFRLVRWWLPRMNKLAHPPGIGCDWGVTWNHRMPIGMQVSHRIKVACCSTTPSMEKFLAPNACDEQWTSGVRLLIPFLGGVRQASTSFTPVLARKRYHQWNMASYTAGCITCPQKESIAPASPTMSVYPVTLKNDPARTAPDMIVGSPSWPTKTVDMITRLYCSKFCSTIGVDSCTTLRSSVHQLVSHT